MIMSRKVAATFGTSEEWISKVLPVIMDCPPGEKVEWGEFEYHILDNGDSIEIHRPADGWRWSHFGWTNKSFLRGCYQLEKGEF